MHDDVAAHPRLGGAVEGVEQLAEGYGGRAVLPAVRVGAGVGDDELVGRGTDRVEQQLAVLGADVTLTGDRGAGQHVVAVDRALPGEHPVVEPQQADHAVRDRAHRDHGADGEAAGPEVGPGGSAGEVVVEHRADVGESQRAGAPLPRVDRDPGELALHLTDLPLVGVLHPGQLGDAAGQPVEPLGERSGAGQPVGGGDQPVDVLREPAGQLDPVAADVVERKRGAEPGL